MWGSSLHYFPKASLVSYYMFLLIFFQQCLSLYYNTSPMTLFPEELYCSETVHFWNAAYLWKMFDAIPVSPSSGEFKNYHTFSVTSLWPIIDSNSVDTDHRQGLLSCGATPWNALPKKICHALTLPVFPKQKICSALLLTGFSPIF